jgi:hypothetical protein
VGEDGTYENPIRLYHSAITCNDWIFTVEKIGNYSINNSTLKEFVMIKVVRTSENVIEKFDASGLQVIGPTKKQEYHPIVTHAGDDNYMELEFNMSASDNHGLLMYDANREKPIYFALYYDEGYFNKSSPLYETNISSLKTK